MNHMTTRQKLRLQLPHKNTKKYYYKKLTKIKYSRGQTDARPMYYAYHST